MNEDRSVVEADGTKESLELTEAQSPSQCNEGYDPSHCVIYEHRAATEAPRVDGEYRLKMPNANQLLAANFKERRHLLAPWLREHQNCMVYAATGIGKSLFALSASLAVAGNADFLGWRPDAAPEGRQWRVFYIDG